MSLNKGYWWTHAIPILTLCSSARSRWYLSIRCTGLIRKEAKSQQFVLCLQYFMKNNNKIFVKILLISTASVSWKRCMIQLSMVHKIHFSQKSSSVALNWLEVMFEVWYPMDKTGHDKYNFQLALSGMMFMWYSFPNLT